MTHQYLVEEWQRGIVYTPVTIIAEYTSPRCARIRMPSGSERIVGANELVKARPVPKKKMDAAARKERLLRLENEQKETVMKQITGDIQSLASIHDAIPGQSITHARIFSICKKLQTEGKVNMMRVEKNNGGTDHWLISRAK